MLFNKKQKKQKKISRFLVLALLCFFFLSDFLNIPQKAATYNINNSDLIEGTADYNTIDLSTTGTMRLQQGNLGSWSTDDGLTEPPIMIYGDSDVLYGPDNTLYLITEPYVDSNRTFFLKYNFNYKKWETLEPPPTGVGTGVSLVWDKNDYMYLLNGGGFNRFFRYSISNNSWTEMPENPQSVNSGAKMLYVTTYNNSYIYTFRGSTSIVFSRFNITTNTWETRSSFPASVGGYGIALTWDNNDTIYALAGCNGEYRKYSIATDTWAPKLNVPSNNNLCQKSQIFYTSTNAIIKIGTYLWGDTSYLQRYDTGTNQWTDLAEPPSSQQYDWAVAAAFDGTDNIYPLLGLYQHPIFYRYNISSNSWVNNGYSLYDKITGYSHGETIFDGDHTVYYVSGNNWGSLTDVYRLDLTTKQKTRIGSYPVNPPKAGIDGVYVNNALYFCSWYGNTTFYKYDLTTNSWSNLTDLPYACNYGTDFLNGGDGYLYVSMGYRNNLYRYSIAGNSWEARANPPASFSTGGGITKIGGDIFAYSGGGQPYFMKYTMASNTWTLLPINIPVGSPEHGSVIIGDQTRYIYFTASNRTLVTGQLFFRFDTTDNTWKRLANLPSNTQVATYGFYDANTQRVYLAPGANLSHLWYWTPTTSSYVVDGIWYSKTIDLTNVQSWSSFSATVAGIGTATFFSRTSSNGRTWDNWTQISSGNIASTPRRYLQLRINLHGDGLSTPIVSNIQFYYNQDTTPPGLPSQFFAKGTKDGETLITGHTYEYQHPYFEWNGATDGASGSGIDGYYVYFGTDGSASPATDGNYQTTNNYTVTLPMTSGEVYYVKLTVKDKMGNLSDTQTFFSYRYWYISPPGSQIATTYEDYSAGVNSNLDLTTEEGSISLKQVAQGIWSKGSFTALPDRTYGPASIVIGDYLYIVPGNNTTSFWRYNLVNQGWETSLAPLPAAANNGSALAWDHGNYLYCIRGNNTTGFYRFNLTTLSWDAPLSALPIPAQAGTDMAYIGNNKILVVFSGTVDFYEYAINTGGWNSLAALPTTIGTYYSGSGVWYDGNDILYVNFGSSDWYQRGLAKYTISLDTWAFVSPPPFNFWFVENNLASDGRGNLYIFGQDYFTNGYGTAIKYNIQTDTWKMINNGFPINSKGTITSDGNRYIYVIPSLGNSRRIVQYDTWNSKFTSIGFEPPSLQRVRWDLQSGIEWYAGQATTATFDGNDTVYILNRNESDTSYLVKYSISKNEYTYLPPPPYIGIGGSIAYTNNYLYYEPGRSRNYFYRLNLNTNLWERMADTLNTIYRPGNSSLIVDKNGNLFMPRGNDSVFYKYTPNAGIGSWSLMRAIPGSVLNASFIYDGDNFIYALRSAGRREFYRYDIGANTWTTLAQFPVSTDYGNSMVIKDGFIYATSGNNRTTTYIYEIGANTWTTGTDSPEPFRYGGYFLKIDDNRALGIPGQDCPDIWQFNFPGTNKAYQGMGIHTSQTLEVQGIYDYAGLNAQVSLPANTDIEFFTRTSDDGNTWNDWTITSETKKYTNQVSTKVNSTAKRYIQIKTILYSYDNIYSPKIESYSLNYYFDVTPPTNPTIATMYSDNTKTTQLQTLTWYNYAHPYFEWPQPGEAGGATDGLLGSHIKGYYVYFGPDNGATPATAGTYTTDNHYEANLTTSDDYFFKLQAVDFTGNIDPEIFSPTTYKFDNVPPENPPVITVTPSGFTTKNEYTFDWPNAFDEHSGIASYCYKTGATTGTYATEQCQTGLNLTKIAAMYTNGTNVFYLRTRDVAGNYASSYISTSFYFSNDPPSKVTNLTAIPPTSTSNMFAFTWDLPALFSGSEDLLTYCYAINQEPPLNMANTVCTPNRYISPFRAATKKGTNVISIIAVDEAGNANWGYPATLNFVANTISPGIPLNLVVSDTSDQANNRWSLTLTWDKPTFLGNGIDHYIIWRADNGANIYNSIGKVSDTAYVDLRVTNEGTFSYKVTACDNVDNCGGESASFTKRPEGVFNFPPKINSGPTVKAGSDRAEITWVTERETEGAVYIGLKQNDLKRDRDHQDLRKEHVLTITELTPKTTYYFKVLSVDSNKNYKDEDAFSGVYSFQTQESPRIYDVTIDPNSITQNSAILTWKTTVPTKSKITFGKSLYYELTPVEGLPVDGETTFVSSHYYDFSNLETSNHSTTYHFKIIADTEFGTRIVSDDYSFDTIPYPEVSNIKFQPVADQYNTVEVSWDTNIPTDSFVSYDGAGVKKEAADPNLVSAHKIVINDLFSNTEYTFLIRGRDKYGSLVTATAQKWRSQIDTRPPKISNVNVEVSTTGTSSNMKNQLIVSWDTDEPTVGQVKYSNGTSNDLVNISPMDNEPKTTHIIVISNLPLAQIYKIQPVSKDLTGNTGYGEITAAIAAEPEYSMLDLIISLLEKILRIK